MKKCSRCNLLLSLDSYHLSSRSKDGHISDCKSCRKNDNEKERIRIKEYRKNNKGYLETNKKYKENNLDFVKKLNKDWSISEKGKDSRKKYYKNNCEKIKEKSAKNRYDNIDVILENEKERRKTDEYKKYRIQYYKKHKSKNPHVYAWRSLLRNTLKRLDTSKSSTTIEMLGYSADDLKFHIESLFKEGMTWDNYGDWHIDHIKPVSLFVDSDDVSIVNSLENLQPLWATENLSKKNKFE